MMRRRTIDDLYAPVMTDADGGEGILGGEQARWWGVDRELARIDAMSDEEIMDEAVRQLGSIGAVRRHTEKTRQMIRDLIAKHIKH
jgi:hypothetical protein